ncbi:MAG: hypothetical protein ABFS08_07675 [Pseudomonadota bacterium]
MRGQSTYVGIIVLLVFIPLMGLSLSALSFQGYTGVLTRIGGLPESDYGWQKPQEVFPEPLFTKAFTAADYQRYYDVVVIGDSFSFDSEKGWQNYFIEQTGLSVITFSHDVPLNSILNSVMFREHPPHFFIVESLEQFSLPRLTAYNSYQSSAVLKSVIASKEVVTLARHQQVKEKITNDSSASFEERIVQRLHNLEKGLERYQQEKNWLENIKGLHGVGEYGSSKGAYVLPLKEESRLFSNKLHDSLLVYYLDITKVTKGALLSDAVRGVGQLQRKVEENGHSQFILMLFPDKLSAYSPWLEDKMLAPPSLIPELSRLYPSQVRLDLAFQRALAVPVIDLYLPNDTHAGYKGYSIAANTLIEYLLGTGMARYN